jgi:hypothetical protein
VPKDLLQIEADFSCECFANPLAVVSPSWIWQKCVHFSLKAFEFSMQSGSKGINNVGGQTDLNISHPFFCERCDFELFPDGFMFMYWISLHQHVKQKGIKLRS